MATDNFNATGNDITFKDEQDEKSGGNGGSTLKVIGAVLVVGLLIVLGIFVAVKLRK